MRWLTHISLPFVFACTLSSPPSILPIGEFIDQVLNPLSDTLASDYLDKAKADLRHTRTPDPLSGSVLGLLDAASGGLASTANRADIERSLMYLESRRLPLKRELLDLFTQRTREAEGIYAVCVEGKERRYDGRGTRFLRLVDGPGPCDMTPLQSLTPPREQK